MHFQHLGAVADVGSRTAAAGTLRLRTDTGGQSSKSDRSIVRISFISHPLSGKNDNQVENKAAQQNQSCGRFLWTGPYRNLGISSIMLSRDEHENRKGIALLAHGQRALYFLFSRP